MRNNPLEAIRKDRSTKNDKLLGDVIAVNKPRGAITVRVQGDVGSVLPDVMLLGPESVYNVSVGDTVAIARFSGQWVALGTVQKPVRRERYTHGEHVTMGNQTTYGETYFHDSVGFGADGRHLYRDGNDLYWFDGTSSTKLN